MGVREEEATEGVAFAFLTFFLLLLRLFLFFRFIQPFLRRSHPSLPYCHDSVKSDYHFLFLSLSLMTHSHLHSYSVFPITHASSPYATFISDFFLLSLTRL